MSNKNNSGRNTRIYRIVALIMALAMVLASCGTSKETKKKKKSSDKKVSTKKKNTPPDTEITPEPSDEDFLTKIQSIDGGMLTIGCENLGPIDWGNDEPRDSDFKLYYDGTMTKTSYHSESDPEVHTVVIPDKDLVDFYLFCQEYADGSEFAGHEENVCDGSMYYFNYYDENGNRNYIFGGYCYELDVLQDIIDLARSFFYPDYSIPCRSFLSTYPEILGTVTNLCSPEITKVDTLPDDVIQEPGYEGYSYDYFYAYTYTTTEDADKGPIVIYLTSYGSRIAVKNNRNWDNPQS